MGKRLGRVTLTFSYVVDLDDADMVDHARSAIAEDVDSIVRENDAYAAATVAEAPDATEDDIPEFLRDTGEMLFGEELPADPQAEAGGKDGVQDRPPGNAREL